MSATFYDLGGKILAVCPKAGSQSIRKALLSDLGIKEIQAHHIKETLIRQGKPVAWFWRHPIQRMQSCWRYFEHTVGWPKETGIVQLDYEGFVDAVLEGASNRHWDPQVPMVTHGRTFLPTEIYDFSQINRAWPEVVGRGTLPHNNKSHRVELNYEYRFWDLVEHYRDDLNVSPIIL